MNDSKVITKNETIEVIEKKNTLEYIVLWNKSIVDKINEIKFSHNGIHIIFNKKNSDTEPKKVTKSKPIEKVECVTVNFD